MGTGSESSRCQSPLFPNALSSSAKTESRTIRVIIPENRFGKGPQANGTIHTTGQRAAAIGREGYAADRVGVSGKGLNPRAGRQIPGANDPVLAARHGPAAVRGD